jgi:hypothetical protein
MHIVHAIQREERIRERKREAIVKLSAEMGRGQQIRRQGKKDWASPNTLYSLHLKLKKATFMWHWGWNLGLSGCLGWHLQLELLSWQTLLLLAPSHENLLVLSVKSALKGTGPRDRF